MEPPPPPNHHFAPVNPDVHVLLDPIDDRYEEPARYEERRPTVQQRLDAMTLEDELRDWPHGERLRSSDPLATSQDYLYFRLAKDGPDWTSVFKTRLSAPIDEIERRAKKSKGGDGPVLEQMTRMHALRRDVIEEVVRKANAGETGDAHWEVVYIKSKKVQTRAKKVEVPEMDIILARTRGRSRSRPRSFGATKSAKEKRYNDDAYSRARKDSGLAILADPIANLPLFDMDGRPRDELGPLHFSNANLPPQIPPEKPLGAQPEKKKDKGDKGGKQGKSRSKSRDKGFAHDDGVYVVPEAGDYGDGGDAALVDTMFGEVPGDNDGHGKSPHEHPAVVMEEDPRRSHSRHRAHKDGRSKSRGRRESVHFVNQHTRQYLDGGDASSENSDTSHYGFEYAESSNTSLGTSGGIARRGSLVHGQPRHDVVYKKHHPGPTRRMSYHGQPYHGEQQFIVPARSRRDSHLMHERPVEPRYERFPPRILRRETAPIPEGREIVHYDLPLQPRTQDMVPVHRYVPHDSSIPPALHYPEDERDSYYRDDLERQSVRVEDYQRDRVRDDYIRQKERELDARAREVAMQEQDLRRLRKDRERGYYDDRDVRRERREPSRQLYYDERNGQYYYYND